MISKILSKKRSKKKSKDLHKYSIENKNFSRILKTDAMELEYKSKRNYKINVVHWGQRKLLMSEVEFLTIYSRPGDVVLYVGSAPGVHTIFLSLLFPFLNFILVDPNPFYCTETININIINDYFTDELAKKYNNIYGNNNNLILISDIRTNYEYIRDENIIENIIENDMKNQQRWHILSGSRHSMLKFRLHWHTDNTKYLNGVIYLPVYGHKTTTESRLVVDKGSKKIIWNNRKYERQMFYFNTVTRIENYVQKYKIPKKFCFNNKFDCTSEIYIWEKYIKMYHHIWKKSKNKIKNICNSRIKGSIHEINLKEKNIIDTVENWQTDQSLWYCNSKKLEHNFINNIIIEILNYTDKMCSPNTNMCKKVFNIING